VSGPDHRVVLAVDPGRARCGVAVCEPGRVLARAVVSREALPALVRDWQLRYAVSEVVIGNRTASAMVIALLADAGVAPVSVVEEAGSTLRARSRYFDEHPARGWRRLVPRTLQTPPEPYDDYAAVLLAEAVLARAGPSRGARGGALM